jgi:hypothetical protein
MGASSRRRRCTGMTSPCSTPISRRDSFHLSTGEFLQN